jgi:stage II sporulation protein GA (sporulation sigma-E factor processing peptidase)
MEIEVYADLLFLVNAGMDWLCFALAGWILHRPLSGWRTTVAAAIGGIYAVVSLLFDIGHAVALAADIAVCLLMCAVVFGGKPSGRRGFWSTTATYFLLSMVLGGVMTALYNLLNRLHLPEHLLKHLPTEEEGPTTWLFGILALAGSAITLWGGRALRKKASLRHCRVMVTLDGKRVTLEGLVDTGNLLRDPLGGRPVICARKADLESILSPALSDALERGSVESLTSPRDARRFRLIPAGTATGRGMLTGFLPDRVEILCEPPSGKSARDVTAVTAVTAVIACADLTETEALVPSELIL